MARYISADDLTKKIFPLGMIDNGNFAVNAKAVKVAIESTPTADVVEVRHGTWYHGTEYGAVYAKCSACGRKMNYSCYGYAYCAMCGARMDGKEGGVTYR